MTARWEELEEFPDYAVSDEGEIANMRSGIPRKMSINQQGIVKISLYKDRKELHTRSLAVLVAEMFVEGQSDLFNTPIHLDGERRNCAASNLMWRPRWFAIRYHRQFYDTAFHNANFGFMDIDSGEHYSSIKEACMRHGLHHHDVHRSLSQATYVPFTNQEFRLTEDT